MSKKKPDLLKEYPEITLTNGDKKEMAVLNITKVYLLLDLVYTLFEKGQGDEVTKGFQDNPAQYVGAVLLIGLRHSSMKVTEFLASLIDVPIQEFEKESIDVTAQLLEGMTRHPDLESFFETLKRINGKKLQNLVSTFSTGQ